MIEPHAPGARTASARTRPEVLVFLGVSLDGFMAGPGGDLAWLSVVETSPPEDTGYDALMARVDTVVLGRNTYDVMIGFPQWPLEGKRVIVLTRRPIAPMNGETTFAGPLADLVDALGREGCRAIYLDGGQAVRQGLQAGLVDELTLSWVPMTLGEGLPLFGPEVLRTAWKMTRSRAFGSGLVQAAYVPVRSATS